MCVRLRVMMIVRVSYDECQVRVMMSVRVRLGYDEC